MQKGDKVKTLHRQGYMEEGTIGRIVDTDDTYELSFLIEAEEPVKIRQWYGQRGIEPVSEGACDVPGERKSVLDDKPSPFVINFNRGYQEGLKDGWELAGKVYALPVWDYVVEAFGTDLAGIFDLSVTDVQEILKQYEKKEIHVNDVIYSSVTDSYALLTYIDSWGHWFCLDEQGRGFMISNEVKHCWEKTGRSLDIKEFISKLRE